MTICDPNTLRRLIIPKYSQERFREALKLKLLPLVLQTWNSLTRSPCLQRFQIDDGPSAASDFPKVHTGGTLANPAPDRLWRTLQTF